MISSSEFIDYWLENGFTGFHSFLNGSFNHKHWIKGKTFLCSPKKMLDYWVNDVKL